MSSYAKNFYSSIPAFHDFSSVLDNSHYYEVPKDWFILLTDIKGSTKAIEQGKYKLVNMIGAASITCVLNSLAKTEIPFVFGGDGATMLIPGDAVAEVTQQLKGLQALAKNEFQIDLRVGLVPVEVLQSSGFGLKVAKYELSAGNALAQFKGGALSRAEEMIKNNLNGAILLQPSDRETSPLLEGLSCRLSPLKSQKGQILSLICKPQAFEKADQTLQSLLDELKIILEDDFRSASPVTLKQLHWKLLSPTLDTESRLRKGRAAYFISYLKVLAQSFVANLSIQFNLPLGEFRPQKYKSELVLNSDFKKFDEMIRMVVDCYDHQIEKIENLLKSHFEQGQIYYGTHKSSEALMTCMVFSATQNKHIHFIDGAQGGYAFAALELKKQMAKMSSAKMGNEQPLNSK